MNLYITDQLISITGDGGELHDMPTSTIERIVIKPDSGSHRIVFMFAGGTFKSLLRSKIGHYFVNGVEDTPVPAIGTIRTTLQSVLNANVYTTVESTALEASHVLKATPGTLHDLFGYSAKTSDQFLQLHDAASLPADTAVPVVSFKIDALSNFSIDYSDGGYYFETGIVVCNSSTQPTKTIGGADCWFNSQIK